MVNNSKTKETILGPLPLEWNVKKIEEICDILDSQRVPLNKEQRESMKGNIPYYGANGVVDYINQYLFDEPLILMAEDGGHFDEYQTRPIAYKIEGKSWVNNHAHVLRPKEGIDFNWVFYSLVHKNVLPFINGGTRAKLNQADLRVLPIAIPPLPEQRKIAAILSSVDEAIEKTEAIIEQTEKVKKGLMQQLLTKGIGHTKFKKTEIGEIPEEWEVKRLSEISLINMGQSPSSAVCNDLGEGIPFFQGNAEFGMKHPIPKRWCTEPTKLANKGDILISVRAPVGELNIANQTCCIGRGLAAITPTKINNDYLYFAMQVYKSSLLKVSQGSTFTAINKQDLHNLLLPVPSLIEQKKISAILLSLDSKFEKEKKKLNQLQFMKTGLMQVLLTGKVRVKVDEDEVMSS